MTAFRYCIPLAVVAAVMAGGIAVWEALVRSASPAPVAAVTAASPNSTANGTSQHSPDIRVALTSAAVDRLTIAVDGPYEVRPVGDPRVLGRGERLPPSDVQTAETGFSIGGTVYRAERIELTPVNSPAIWVGDHQYRGSVRLFRGSGGTTLAVNVLPLSDYLASVVDSEMPASFPEAARCAQAIVARTYALYQMANRHPQFDVYASTRSQKYLGYQYRDSSGRRLAGESASSRAVVQQTRGIVCTWQGRLFCTYYSAVCGGATQDGRALFADAAPPLTPVACEWCKEAPLYRWTVAVSAAEMSRDLGRTLAAKGAQFGPLRSLEMRDTTSGPVLRVGDGRSFQHLSLVELRHCLSTTSLPSARYRVEKRGERVLFHGRGHGHGAGLCQWGARGLALAGWDALDIVRHYYPGAKLVTME